MTTHRIKYLKSKEDLKEIKGYALSNHDIKELTPHTNIFTYPELKNFRSIDEVFSYNNNGVGTAIMLYLTDNEKTGHWIALIKRGNKIEMYDPYGNRPEELNKKVGGRMNGVQNPHLLRDLVERSGYDLVANGKQVQPLTYDVATCGRHSIMRVLFSNLSLNDYNKKIAKIAKDNGVSIDDIATGLTYEMLDK